MQKKSNKCNVFGPPDCFCCCCCCCCCCWRKNRDTASLEHGPPIRGTGVLVFYSSAPLPELQWLRSGWISVFFLQQWGAVSYKTLYILKTLFIAGVCLCTFWFLWANQNLKILQFDWIAQFSLSELDVVGTCESLGTGLSRLGGGNSCKVATHSCLSNTGAT